MTLTVCCHKSAEMNLAVYCVCEILDHKVHKYQLNFINVNNLWCLQCCNIITLKLIL